MALAVALAVALAQPLGADDPPKPEDARRERAYRRHLSEVSEHLPYHPLRAGLCYVEALQVKPDGWEAYLGLMLFLRDQRAMLSREAYRLAPDAARAKYAATVALGGKLPESRKFGTATRLEAAYVGRSFHDMSYDAVPSVEVGQALDRRRLLIHGLDDAGNLVPTDPVFEVDGGLALDPDDAGRILAASASTKSLLRIRDRKGGQSTEIALRVLGPATSLLATSGREAVGPGELLHFRADIKDAAGNPLWLERLVWTARTPGGERLGSALKMRPYSWVDLSVSYERHLNSLLAPEDGYRGPLAVTAIDPVNGAKGEVAVRLVDRAVQPDREMGRITWIEGLEAGHRRAADTGRVLMAYIHADW